MRSKEFVIYPDATQDHGRVVCRTYGTFLGTLSHSAVSACARGRGRYEPLVSLHLCGWIPMHRGRVWIGASKSSASGSHQGGAGTGNSCLTPSSPRRAARNSRCHRSTSYSEIVASSAWWRTDGRPILGLASSRQGIDPSRNQSATFGGNC
jgi:hypothetical protein